MPDSVLSVVRGDAALSTFASAVDAVPGLADLLDRGAAVTVLAPSDDAFAAAPEVLVRELLSDPHTLAGFLRGHLVAARDLSGAEQVTTADGRTVVVGGSVEAPTFDGVPSRPGAVAAANGTVFVIDTVLVPAG